ncbi:hypothetical protein FWJ25_08865 [Marinobacter salinexigens]|uniref:Uncharacterized protein n=1 Tax=Marinobacter salinexigens TaxID=2919747 RepID=A0A5B0VIW3_9GAMM|nr:hypothetical protein [Marinobacter salinexigens]KAA1174338.1 hypothetical protein FWJ25_08865 [Marinobacter salinexigens]
MIIDMRNLTGLLSAGLLGLCLLPGVAAAESDYDVTMRMVMDDEALDSSFVQEMEIPETLPEIDTIGPGELGSSNLETGEIDSSGLETIDLNDVSDDTRTLVDSLSNQVRDTRDTLNDILPVEDVLRDTLDLLPGDSDLNLLDEDGLNLLDGGHLNPDRESEQ